MQTRLTIEQAIYQLSDLIKDAETHRDGNGELDDVFQNDIEALKMGQEALDRQMPKAPRGDYDSVPHYRCPNPKCKMSVKTYDDSPKRPFCLWCGQALDWNKTK